MAFLITYDITSNKKRLFLIKKLKQLGFRRIQKSVFLGDASTLAIQNMVNQTKEIKVVDNANDLIFAFSISEQRIFNAITLGKIPQLDLALNQLTSMVI